MFRFCTRRNTRHLRRKRKLFWIRTGAITVSVLLLLGFLSWFSFHESIAVSDIEVEGNSVLEKTEILDVAKEKLSGRYFLLFSRGNVFTYSRGGIERALLSAYPRIREVEVGTTGLSSIKIDIHERSPHAMWCKQEAGEERETVNDCYFLDSDGYLFARAPEFTGTVFFEYRGPLEDKENVIGQQFLTRSEFIRLDLLRELLRDSNTVGRSVGDPSRMVIVDEDDAEIYFEGGGILLFARRHEQNTLLANVEAIFNSYIFEGEDLDLLDYIDLRFGNKVYFRFRE